MQRETVNAATRRSVASPYFFFFRFPIQANMVRFGLKQAPNQSILVNTDRNLRFSQHEVLTLKEIFFYQNRNESIFCRIYTSKNHKRKKEMEQTYLYNYNNQKKKKVPMRNLRVRSGEDALLLGSLGLLG